MASVVRSFAQRPSKYFVSPAGTYDNPTAGGAIGFIPRAITQYLTGATLIGSIYMYPTYTAMIADLNRLVNTWVQDYSTGAGDILQDMGKEIYVTYRGQNEPALTMRLLQVTREGGTTGSTQNDPETSFDTFYFTTASNSAVAIAASITALGGASNGNIASVRLIRT